MVDATLRLLKKSYKEKFDYYHLISGVTLPIKKLNTILSFYLENNGKEFVTLMEPTAAHICCLTHYRILNPRSELRKFRLFNYIEKKFFNIPKIKHKFPNTFVYKLSSQWFSITNNCCEFILKKQKWIKSNFKWTWGSDENFLSTILYNSEFKNKIYGFNMLFEDWAKHASGPKILNNSHLKKMNEPSFLFARKFDDSSFEQLYKIIKDNFY